MVFRFNIPLSNLSIKKGIFFLFTLFLFNGTLPAQWLYEIDGTVTTDGKRLEGAVVTLYKGDAQAQQISTSSNGKFKINLDPDLEYTLSVTKSGFITKKFIFSTKGVPSEIAKNFEAGAKPEIDIFELPTDPAIVAQVNSILTQPVAKYLYDPTEQDIVVFDKAYSASMLQELNRLIQQEKEVKKKQQKEAKNQQANAIAAESKYKQAISKGDAAFSKEDYATAKASYQDALTIKKAEPYPVAKLVEIEKLVTDAAKNAQLEADYKAAIAKADKALEEKKYDNAKAGYTDALKLKSSEKYPKSKLDEIAKLLENDSRNKELDVKYNALIAAGDKAFAAKTYDVAKTNYTEAAALKSGEKYPKTQLAEIERLQNELNARNKSAAELLEKYKAAIAKGDKALGSKDYSAAKNAYKEAVAIQPNESYPKDKIAEIDKLLSDLASKDALEKERQAKEKEMNAKYETVISKADKAFSAKDYASAKNSYTEAASLKNSEQYPKDKLAEIDKLMAELAGKEAAEKERLAKENELDSKYTAAIAAGDKAMEGKDYSTAKTAYSQALTLKSNEKYPKTKLEEIEKIMTSLNELNTKYNAALTKADAAFKVKAYADAKKLYQDALSYKSTEHYVKDKIAEIDSLLAKEAGAKELDIKYNESIAKADKLFASKNYAGAKMEYTEATGIKPSEAYPKTKIAEIDKLMSELASKEAAEKERLAKEAVEKELNNKYNASIVKADKLFSSKDYAGAKAGYTEAITIKPSETYPKTRIAEIEKLLSDLAAKELAEKERLTKEKALNEKYNAMISKGDAAFSSKDYVLSKTAYTEATGLKPTEQYPKDRLKAIDVLLNNALKEQEQKYKAAITKADAAYIAKDYASAKSGYEEAKAIQPAENYPKDQIAKIDVFLAEAGKEKELKARYTASIAKGDVAMQKKEYENALAAYKEALAIKSSESYPSNKISEINKILDEQVRNKEKEKQYAGLITKADKAMAAKDYKEAKATYLDASLIKPTERYPKEKVIEIDNILNPKVNTAPVTAEKSKDDFRNELAKKYPQGVTEESATEGNLKVIRRIVVRGDDAHLYLKKITSFGAIYYFKDNVAITEAEFVKDTESVK